MSGIDPGSGAPPPGRWGSRVVSSGPGPLRPQTSITIRKGSLSEKTL